VRFFNLFLIGLRRATCRRTTLRLGALALSLLLQVEREHLGIFGTLRALLLSALLLERHDLSLALQALRRDETLNLGRLELRLRLALLELKWLAHDILAHVVLLAQVEELANMVGTLGTTNARHNAVGETINLLLALLDNDKRQHAELIVHDAALDRLATTLAAATLTIARHALGHEQANTIVGEDALLHREALLVVTTAYANDVALPFVA